MVFSENVLALKDERQKDRFTRENKLRVFGFFQDL